MVAAQGYKKVKSADIAKISEDKEQLGTIEKSNVTVYVSQVFGRLLFI